MAWVRFNQGLERETLEVAQAAYELQVELDDRQGIADSRFFLALCLLCCGDLRGAKPLLNLVHQYALEMNITLYRKWASTCFTIIDSMEANMCQWQSVSCSFPNHFSAFTSRLWFLLFSIHSRHSVVVYHARLQQIYRLATTDAERALCLLFAANLLAGAGDPHRAVMILALAYRYPAIVTSWIVNLRMFVEMVEKLKAALPAADYARAWEQGQSLDLASTAIGLLQELVTYREHYTLV
jgi:hypothetical protein